MTHLRVHDYYGQILSILFYRGEQWLRCDVVIPQVVVNNLKVPDDFAR
jgi:hypothetical protein